MRTFITTLFLFLNLGSHAQLMDGNLENRLISIGHKDSPKEQNFREFNFRQLIRDTALLNRTLKGDYAHPAIEIAAKKSFKPHNSKHMPIRVALDPGHIATNRDEAEMEQRYIKGRDFFVYEKELNMATALVLKQKLEQRGYDVMLSHEPGSTALGKSFTDWYKEDFRGMLEKDLDLKVITQEQYDNLIVADKRTVFNKYFKDKEFIARGERINAFQPDIAIMIHYNSSEFIEDPSEDTPIVNENYSVAFIPGGFTLEEMKQEHTLEDFVRLSSSDIINKSKLLSGFIVDEFSSKLKAPALLPNSYPNLWYLDKYSVYARPGVYSRNLFMTREIESPLCYGECFLQNTRSEMEKLKKRDYKIGPYKISSRVKDVADCYYIGIIKYFKEIGVREL